MPLFGQSVQNSPTLSPEEKRLVLGQLYELKVCREEVTTYRDYVSRDTEQDAREKANFERSIELEKQATGLAKQERDLANEKATMWEQLYKAVSKKPGVGCRIWRFLTAGIHRCT